jgi:nucleotide-binding universal stress UspA family protein
MHDPRSILLHLDNSARTPERIALARLLAETFDAQVAALPCTMPALLRYPYAMDAAAEAVAIMQDLDKQCRDRIHAAFQQGAAGSARLHWEEPLADEPWGFARRALYADLLVLSQNDRDAPDAGDLPPDFLSSLLVECGRPALVLPYIGALVPPGRKVLLAWKEAPEAARAVSAALPWLRRAREVHAVCYGESPELALNDLQGYLKLQGVHATLHPGGDEHGDAGARLLSFAADLGADLLVMGCYGHSRAREWVLGGFTRAILESMTLPVLMVH